MRAVRALECARASVGGRIRRDARRGRVRAAGFGESGPWVGFRSDKSEIKRLEYLLECARRDASERALSEKRALEALQGVEDARDMYAKRLKESEKDVFKLEKALEEKTAGVETAMSVARRQIKWQEERYAELEGRFAALERECEVLRSRIGMDEA